MATVLVGTLIAVYSTIRYDSSQNQSPQVLTATDETDSAILKALGFTVGYYGSILQVTGNSTYARANATAYMNSALQYISSMNPSWGATLNMTSLNLSTNWFTNSSISTGQISVLYNLAGLGLSGINYTSSCSLGVQIFNSPSNNQVCLNVTQDGTQPQISLGQQNFNFYSYVYSNMTWQLVQPNATPTVFTNGTYIINVPIGIDTSAYAVQVTDARGIMVIASSFSSYNITFAIGPSAQTLYTHQETTNINGTNYYNLLTSSADNSGLTLNASMGNSRTLFGKSVYSLQNVSSIPAGTWTMYYRAWQDAPANIGFDSAGSGTTNAISYVPITITNTQSSATPNPFQQKVTWNPSTYSSYEASDLGNIRFYSDSALTIPLYAWLELCTPSLSNTATNATAWVKLTSPIGANGGTLTIYMAFLSTSTDFDGNYWGNAPNLSTTYGQYDNGANVFSFYDNFAGTTLNAKWTKTNSTGGTVAVNNGATFSVSSGSDWVFIYSATQSPQKVAEAFMMSCSGDNPMIGLETSSSVNGYHSMFRGYSLDWWAQTEELCGENQTGGTNGMVYQKTATVNSFPNGTWSLYWAAAGTEGSTDGAGNVISSNDNSVGAIANYGIFVGISDIGSGGSNTVRWARMRVYPPSNVMPSVSSGSITPSSSNSISWSHTTGSGSNRIMIVGVSIQSSTVSVSNITYGSQSLAFIRNDTNPSGIRSEIWYLIAPQAGTATITVNLSSNANATVGSCTYTGVSQTSPLDSNAGLYGTSSSPSRTITVNTANSFLLANLGTIGNSTVSSEGSGQTKRWDQSISSCVRGHGSEEGPDGSGNQSISWSLSGSATWATSIVALKPVATAVGYVDVDALIRKSDNSIRTTIATSVAPSGNLQYSPTTLSGTYSWSTYTVANQTDYLELDYYVDTTTTASTTAYLSIDNQTSALTDQTRIANVTWPLFSLQSSPVTIELLQNGTMRWLGQNLQNSTLIRPIPPIPVKAFHLSPMGTKIDLPYQVEDWASQYQIPLGLTSNYTVFGNNQMIVFQMSAAVPQVTLWWNGSDSAVQPSSGFADTYFTADNPNGGTLTNGNTTIQVNYTLDASNNNQFQITSTTGSVTSVTKFMRVNAKNSTYGSGDPAYIIHHGVVRDIIQEEAEWSNGITNSPNVYSQIVLTLPANSTYFTYQGRLIFINSAISRNITDLSPIQLTTNITNPQVMTENGTAGGLPYVSNSSGVFYNYGFPNGPWTPHHWSQLINNSTGQGTGIMFTDAANQQLFAFDSMANKTTGGLYANASVPLIEIDPVTSQGPVSFNWSLDLSWFGAVATFTSQSPIYTNSGSPTGLWQLVEQPPVITVTPTNANGASIILSPNTGPVGTSVAVSGSGFYPNSNITITYDGNTMVTTVANASGFIPSGVMFNIPASVAGSTHIVTATDAFANSASASFTVGPLISLNPTASNVGSTITVTGSGFAANSTITLSFDGLNQTTSPTSIVSSNTGGFSATFTIPESAAGIHTVQATDGTNSFAATFNITSSISLNPNTGVIGSTVSVSGSGFAANSLITIKFDGTNQSTSPAVIATGSTGSFSATFVVPASAIGSHTVASVDASSNSASATFTVTPPSITLVPTSGVQNSSVTVSGSNFLPNSTVTLTFAGTSVSTSPYPIIVSGNGSFSASFTVPSSSPGGKTVTATDASNNSASATYTVTVPTVSLNPSSGPIGTTVTVSGSSFLPNSALTITYDGTTVATATSTGSGAIPSGVTFTVPASVFGSHTVRVIDANGNAATATFSVVASINFTPVTGPVGTSITISGQGFAASSTITVKFNGATVTTSPTTVTTNNTGSFSSVTFTVPSSSSGSKPIQATDAASNAASGTFTVTSSITLNPTNGGIGTTVTITGKGLAAFSTITINYDNGTQATSPSPVTSDANGNFSCSFTVPTSTAGAHTVLATDGTNSPTATFTVNTVLQPITVTVSNSAPSATVTVNGGNPSPSTFAADGTSHNINMTAGASFTLSFSNAGNTRYGFAVSGLFSATSNSYVASATPVAVTAYEQVQNTFSVTLSGGNPSSGDTLNLTGTLLGSTANILSLNVGSQSSASSLAWTDYNTIVTFPGATTMSNSTQRWAINGLYSTPALTTGGNTYSQTYYHQYQMTLSYSVSGGGSPTAPTFTANRFGSSAPVTLTGSATGYWFDAGSWSVTNPAGGSGSSERWSTSQATGSVSAGTLVFTYYHQYLETLSYSVSGGGSGYSAPTFSANAFGVSAPQTLTTTATGYWFDAGSSWSVTNPLTGSGSSERWQTSQSTSGTVSVQTIAFVYNHQYQLTMATNFGTTSPVVGTSWVNAGSSVTIYAVITNGTNERYLWAGWTGTGTGSYTGTGNNSALVTMNGAITETASWIHQYYLTVSSAYGSPTGQGWYNAGSSASFAVTTPASGGTGTQYVFTSWSGSGSGSYNGTSSSQSVTMNNPITETANWQTQYQVTFNYQVSGGGSGYSAPSVTYYQSGSQLSVTAGPSATVWVDSGSTYTYTNNPLRGSGASERWYALSGTSGTISSSTTINPTYYHQYSLTVTASPSGAIGGTFRITYTQFGTTYTNQQQTTTWNSWADASTTATVSSPQSPVGSYAFSSYSPSASVTMNQAQTITLVYMGNLGNTNTGTNTQPLSNYLRGIPVTATETGTIQSISAYVNVGSTYSTYRHIKAALYTTSGTLVGSTDEITGLSGGAQWVTMSFSGTKPSLTAGTTYVLVVWADSGMSSVSIYYSSTPTNAGRYQSRTYGTWPNPASFTNDNYLYCIYCTYSVP